MKTPAGLLSQIQGTVGERLNAATPEERQRLFAEIWDGIRKKGLYGGQPSSENSNDGVQLARFALSVATQTSDQLLLVEAWCMMAYTLNANEQYAESLEHYRRAIDCLEKVQDHPRAARTRLGYLTALSMAGRHDEAIEAGLLAEQWFLSNGDEEGHARLCVNLGNVYQRLDQHARSLQIIEPDRPVQSRRSVRLGSIDVNPFLEQGAYCRLVRIFHCIDKPDGGSARNTDVDGDQQ